MNEIIKRWISGSRNFTIGTILYNKYGSNEELKKLFEKGKTDYTQKKLLEELEAIVSPKAISRQPLAVSHQHEVFPPTTNKVLNGLREQWMPLYTEMNYKRHELDKFLFQKTEAATRRRGKLAMEILSLEKKCMAIWSRRDHYIEFNKLPGIEKPDPVIDPVKMVERLKNVQGYIRRYKMYLRKDPANAKNIELLQQYEEEFESLKKKCARK